MCQIVDTLAALILPNICPKLALYLLYACSWVAHGPLMGLSWDALCELSLQGYELGMNYL